MKHTKLPMLKPLAGFFCTAFLIPAQSHAITLAFQPQVAYPVGDCPNDVAVSDVNGDGKPDLLVPNSCASTVGVLLGNGDGTFLPQVVYGVYGNNSYSIAVGDMNGDGKPDLAVATGYNWVSVLLGNGDGTFQPHVDYISGIMPWGIAMGDLNGDGKPDLATADTFIGNSTSDVFVFLGNGDGTLLQPHVEYLNHTAPYGIVLGDMNGDGKLDLAVTDMFDNNVRLALGKGDGTFRHPVDYPTFGGSGRIVMADMNGDGKPDLAASNSSDNTVSVLLGNGDGTLQPRMAKPVGAAPNGIAAGDINGDGKPDLAVSNTSDNTIGVLLGNGDGTLQPQVAYPTSGSFYGGSYGVAVADLNGDGKPDLAVANAGGNSVSVLLNESTQPDLTCLFNWVEQNDSSLYAPAGSPTLMANYTYRYYSATNAYLGFDSAGNHVYYQGPDGKLLEKGPLSAWLTTASCQTSANPNECGFTWAEMNYPKLFAPAGAPMTNGTFTYRDYPATQNLLGVASFNHHLYSQAVGGPFKDQGTLSSWLTQSGCQ